MARKGRKAKESLPENIRRQCHVIIHSAATAAGAAGTGLAQIPLSDNAVIVPIQVAMIITLGKKVFGRKITESAAKGIISSAAASFVGRGISQAAVGWIPVLGNAVNTATAAGITEAIGWIAAKEFANHGSRYEKAEVEDESDSVPVPPQPESTPEPPIAQKEQESAEYYNSQTSQKYGTADPEQKDDDFKELFGQIILDGEDNQDE